MTAHIDRASAALARIASRPLRRLNRDALRQLSVHLMTGYLIQCDALAHRIGEGTREIAEEEERLRCGPFLAHEQQGR